MVGNLRLWLPQQPLLIPYLRSSTGVSLVHPTFFLALFAYLVFKSAFYDGLLVLNKYKTTWIVDRFFSETMGISYDALSRRLLSYWASSTPPTAFLADIERGLIKVAPAQLYMCTIFSLTLVQLVIPHIRSLWFNPPRRRRHFMKSLLDWHALYDISVRLVDELDLEVSFFSP